MDSAERLGRLIAGISFLLLLAASENTMASTVTLAWDPPVRNTDNSTLTDLAGYKLHYGTASGVYDRMVDVGNVTSFAVTGLQDGQRYYSAVKAYNSASAESDFCTELSFVAPDKTPPVITAPPARTIAAGANGNGIIPDLVAETVVTDNISARAAITLVQNPVAGTQRALGVTAVTLTATDAAGNSSQASVNVTVADQTPPTIVPPANATATGNAADLAPVPNFASQATVSDNCSAVAQITVTQVPLAGTLVGLGTTRVTLTATDAAGNSAQASVNLVVNPMNRAPQVNAGADQTVRMPDATAQLTGTATDDNLPVGSSLTVAWTKVSGPGTVTFANASSAATTAAFSTTGTYVLRLTASDGALTASDELTVVVAAALKPNPPTNLRISLAP